MREHEQGADNHTSGAATAEPAARTGYCEGLGTDMHMSGFVWGTSECLNFLLTDWKLDSPLRFYAVRAAPPPSLVVAHGAYRSPPGERTAPLHW